jgi:2-polyprenyl-3-methyl-5-hydroxy-6-metoxy-1,4-benzoquinol methylase
MMVMLIEVHDAKLLMPDELFDDTWLQRLSAQIAHWNDYARDPFNGYEPLTRRLRYVAPAKMVELLRPYLQKNMSVLDLGSGTGLVGKELVKDGCTVDGVDFSKEMLRKATRHGYRELLCADLRQEKIEFFLPGRTYDAIVSVGVYGDFVEPQWFSSVLPMLSPNAVVALAGRTNDLLPVKEILEKEGFEIVAEERGIAHYTIVYSPVEYIYIIAKR